ncbi:MAG: hypothetical protein ACD_65C00036G0002 [uncultured bacterium]|nr:MAG: hypothetical protein ACD_65C00036G0002 [uncultured bacterium]KKT02218.1 MAG: hypothetical protein UV80_C0005G0063 [Candidatus Peregrinibacteria bacterium GW2011_GWF2_43_17]HAU40021.1 hypothetical protein [Candidatus Peregrinibacteria bacterium]
MPLAQDEQLILDSIKVPSDNDPLRPEFPDEGPKFPATPTYKIEVPRFKYVWLKDESFNPTGTHKDRMAWEMVVTYRDLLIAKKRGIIKKLPHLSIISSGSAANAIQTALRKYRLPNLKILVGYNIDKETKRNLKKIGCEIYETDLAKKPLNAEEILRLTNNPDGIDITSDESLDPDTRFYDWLSYEILNNSPDYCFIPYGSGHLYENLLNVSKREIMASVGRGSCDPRFKGDVKKLEKCHFMGAATHNPNSLADKLYCPHQPFIHFDGPWLEVFRSKGYCGKESQVHSLQEKYLKEAMILAKKLGVKCEPSGIAGLGLLLQMQKEIPKDKKIVIVSTGINKWVKTPLII